MTNFTTQCWLSFNTIISNRNLKKFAMANGIFRSFIAHGGNNIGVFLVIRNIKSCANCTVKDFLFSICYCNVGQAKTDFLTMLRCQEKYR